MRTELPAAALTLMLAMSAGGCSFSYQLDSLFTKSDKSDQTGSLRSTTPKQVAVMPPEHDLEVARAAVAEVLTKGGKDAAVPWENPRTGARGTVTPIASAYSQNGLTCHDFLASYVRNGTESWLHGEACRNPPRGKWEVRTLKPWKST
jgi:surface antigen